MKYVGVDLGQRGDYTAIAIVDNPESEWNQEKRFDPPEPSEELHLLRLERPPLNTPYPAIVDRLAEITGKLEGESTLVVDETGVGIGVCDMMRTCGLYPVRVTITGGDRANWEAGRWRVPKRDLITALVLRFENDHLKIPKSLGMGAVFRKELVSFRRKINLRTAHDSYEAWRESDHDDLVLAVSLCAWYAGKHPTLRAPTISAAALGL